MNIAELFPSAYLKAADFPQPRVLTIATITVEEIGDEKQRKPVLHFAEGGPSLVLNKTNAQFLAHGYGTNTDAWIGRPIEARKEPVPFGGRIVDAIRVRGVAAAPVQQPVASEPNDDIEW